MGEERERPPLLMYVVSLKVWLAAHFGTLANAEGQLGLGSKTLTRWLNQNPKYFLLHLPELKEMTGTDYDTLVEMVLMRCKEVEYQRANGAAV